METTVFDVIGNVFQVLGMTDAGLTVAVVKEFTFETVEQCWQAAQAFNEASKAISEPLVMVCWPNPADALVVNQ